MNTQHTPGPWHRNIKPATHYNTIFAGRNTHVTRLAVEGKSEEEVEANCALIVAAPDLLAALFAIVERVDPLGGDAPDSAECRLCGQHPGSHAADCSVTIAKAAIAKATGAA